MRPRSPCANQRGCGAAAATRRSARIAFVEKAKASMHTHTHNRRLARIKKCSEVLVTPIESPALFKEPPSYLLITVARSVPRLRQITYEREETAQVLRNSDTRHISTSLRSSGHNFQLSSSAINLSLYLQKLRSMHPWCWAAVISGWRPDRTVKRFHPRRGAYIVSSSQTPLRAVRRRQPAMSRIDVSPRSAGAIFVAPDP